MQTAQEKISAALRRKYRSPRDALRALGLDENLVPPAEGDVPTLRGTIESLLKGKLSGEDLAAVLAAIDRRAGDDDPMSFVSKDAAVDPFGPVKKLLRDKGLSDADIERAIKLAGPDGNDQLPDRRPPAMDAAIARRLDDRFGLSRIAVDPNVRQAADRRSVALGPNKAAIDRFNAKFPDAARVG